MSDISICTLKLAVQQWSSLSSSWVIANDYAAYDAIYSSGESIYTLHSGADGVYVYRSRTLRYYGTDANVPRLRVKIRQANDPRTVAENPSKVQYTSEFDMSIKCKDPVFTSHPVAGVTYLRSLTLASVINLFDIFSMVPTHNEFCGLTYQVVDVADETVDLIANGKLTIDTVTRKFKISETAFLSQITVKIKVAMLHKKSLP